MSEATVITAVDQPLLLQVAHGKVPSRPPVWFMRQAGRYMPEYQAIRKNFDFLELCKNLDAAVAVSLQPWKAFGTDAVIMFSDILVPPEAMGMTLHFTEKGPVFEDPIRTDAQVEALRTPDVEATMGFVPAILRQLRRELAGSPETALIGFSGAPWTLATYMIEGGVSKQFRYIKQWRFENQAVLHSLLSHLTQVVIAYLCAQIEAGAHVVQLFDTWGAILDKPGFAEFVQPYQQQVIAGVKAQHPNTPIVLYINGSNPYLEAMVATGANVISLDHATPIAEARQRLGNALPLQGNLDPVAMLIAPEKLKPLVTGILQQAQGTPFIFNVGHGLIPPTPPENVRQVVQWVKGLG